MLTIIMTIHVITALVLILLVLLQSGKGAEVSASFGGSSQTIFGSSGGANFFVKLTWAAVIIFASTSITLTVMGTPKSVVETEMAKKVPVPVSQPVAPIEEGAVSEDGPENSADTSQPAEAGAKKSTTSAESNEPTESK